MTSGRPSSEVNVLVKDHLSSNFDAANDVEGIASNSDLDFHTGLFDDSSDLAQIGVPPGDEAPMDTPGSAIDGSGRGVIQYMDGSVNVHIFVNRTHTDGEAPKKVSEELRNHVEDLVLDNQKALVDDDVRYMVPGPRSFIAETEKDPTLFHRVVPVFYNYDLRPS